MYMDKIASRIKAKAKKDALGLKMFSCLGRSSREEMHVDHLAWRDVHKPTQAYGKVI